MLDFSRVQNYYIACGYTDMRKQIDGLAALVQTQFGQEMEETSLYRNRSIIPRYRKPWFPALTLPRTTTSFLLTRGADHQSRSSCSVLRAQAIG